MTGWMILNLSEISVEAMYASAKQVLAVAQLLSMKQGLILKYFLVCSMFSAQQNILLTFREKGPLLNVINIAHARNQAFRKLTIHSTNNCKDTSCSDGGVQLPW